MPSVPFTGTIAFVITALVAGVAEPGLARPMRPMVFSSPDAAGAALYRLSKMVIRAAERDILGANMGFVSPDGDSHDTLDHERFHTRL